MNPPAVVAAGGLLVTPRRVLVLRARVDAVVLGDDLAGAAHVALLERAPQPVADHRVDERRVPHAQPFARARQQVRAVAHRLHAAGDGDVDVADGDALGGEHDRLESGAAHLVDGERGDVIGQPAAERRLPRRVLPEPGETTLPMMHSSTIAGSMPARRTASATTSAPSCGAVKSLSAPRNLPVGVRTALTMTTSRSHAFGIGLTRRCVAILDARPTLSHDVYRAEQRLQATEDDAATSA